MKLSYNLGSSFMPELNKYNKQFKQLKACVIIPTYNNETSIAGVIADVLKYTTNIIVVNDGSTDKTFDNVATFTQIQLISYTKNAGKGIALQKAFAHALNLGYQYAITIDADGQHFAKDLPTFINKLADVQNAIFVGARNMNQDSVPGGSSFGNKFSNFWFKVETGISLPDTQSGYRLYPLCTIKNLKFFTPKYEFEIEILVKAAWKGIKILAIPVSVYYAPKAERVSHFRPFKDFFRISILNTVLVLITFLYIKPRNIFKSIFVNKNFKAQVQQHIFSTHHSAQLKAISIAFGIFMGIIPIWGFQLMAAIFLAVVLKLNKALVIIAANISIPPMIPLIIFASYKIGAFWMGSNAIQFTFSKSITLSAIKQNLQQYIYGSLSLAIIAAVFFGILSFLIIKLFSKKI